MPSPHLLSILCRQFSNPVHARTSSIIATLALLAGCAGMPAPDQSTTGSASVLPAASTQRPTSAAASAKPPRAASAATQPRADTTFTLPSEERVSLATYRTQMRARLMETEGASAEVADCAAHASWVVPRSSSFDALKVPNGALRPEQAQVKPWEGRFSPVKQAVPVTQVVMFDAEGHRRGAADSWVPVKVRCGYKDGMMLAYELLDADGATITEAARPAPGADRPAARASGRQAAATRNAKTGKAGATKAGAKSSKTVKSGAKPAAKKSAATSATKKSKTSSR